jgi:hypothetical protein
MSRILIRQTEGLRNQNMSDIEHFSLAHDKNIWEETIEIFANRSQSGGTAERHRLR